jgi:hypothetical protein
VKNRFFSILFLGLSLILMSAGLSRRLEKAFEALSIYNYFKAKELFYKSLEKDCVAASYGLSVIYARDDNPFTQIDSAHKFINIAERNWPGLEEKIRNEYAEVGVDSVAISNQSYRVDSVAFEKVKSRNEIQVWDDYIKNYDRPAFRQRAISLRNEMIFRKISEVNTAAAYFDFMDSYPEAEQFEEAEKLYDLRNYEEQTAEGTPRAYQLFIDSFPGSPYRPNAEEWIYNETTASGKVDDYMHFIESYPDNPFVELAWRRIYAAEVKELNAENIAAFTLSYPDYPFMEELRDEFELAVTRFYPITDGEKWGFIDDDGKVAIPVVYDWVESFSNGIAMVGKDDDVIYIGKEGKQISDKRFTDGFSFNKGFAVVEKDDFFGIINRLGEYVAEPVYDDIGENSEGLFYAMKDGNYGFINESGEVVIDLNYSDALDFRLGLAVVADSSGKKGLINKEGEAVTSFNYDWIESFSSIELPVRFRKDGLFGLLSRGGLELTDTLYTALGEFSEGLALAASEDRYGFLNTKADTVVDFSYTYKPEALTNSKFVNGHAKVFQKDKVGIIDSTEAKVFPAIFEDVGIFQGKLIPVKKRGKWGYSDLDVNLAIPYQFDFADNFKDSLAIAGKEGRFGVIDTLGKVRVPFLFTGIEWMDTLLLVQDSAIGLITLAQDTLVSLEYTEAKKQDERIIQFKSTNGNFDYFDLKTKRFLRKEENQGE